MARRTDATAPRRQAAPPRNAATPRFAPEALRDLAGDAVFAHGEASNLAGQVELLSDDGRRVLASVPGTGRRFIAYREAGGWAQGVLDQVEALVGAGQAPLALDLLDEIFSRIGRALETVDDSDGGGGEILGRAASANSS